MGCLNPCLDSGYCLSPHVKLAGHFLAWTCVSVNPDEPLGILHCSPPVPTGVERPPFNKPTSVLESEI